MYQLQWIYRPMYNELSRILPELPTTPKRVRDEATEDILGDNDNTPRQRDFFNGRKKRKQVP